uniref:Histone-binding protein RBBP4-like N-terminal domain-containing protein n=1 Tax=Candidozyma auris TaxID=498019 RepID=A0A0L0P268_CANAR
METIAAQRQILGEHQLREQVINEEFKIWKKTVPLLYDTIHTQALEHSLLSVDFLPNYTYSDDKNTISVQLVLGTNSYTKEADFVRLASLDLPATLAPDFSKDAILLPDNNVSTFKITKSWNHPGEVNKVKVSPDGRKIATFDNTGVIHLFDIEESNLIDYKFHSSEGYSLEWVSQKEFLSGANDAKIVLWDVSNPGEPIKQFNSHSAVINDISYSKPSQHLFASVADDFTTHVHDIRSPSNLPAIAIENSHAQNAVAAHPEIALLIATGGKDNVVNLWDLRNTKEPVRLLFGHNDSVVGLKWDPGFSPSHLYSWALDKRVLTWDLNNLGTEYTYPTSETDSRRKTKFTEDPCLKFVHGGHTNRINEVAVHPKIPDLFASVGDDTLLEVFKPKTIVEEEEEENEGGEKQEEKENASKEEKMDVDGKNDGNKEGEKEEADAEKSS